jgi:hypothetical protein
MPMNTRSRGDTVEHDNDQGGAEMHASDEITIRLSRPEDRVSILRLAQLDERRAPSGDSLLAIVGGELRAALPLGDGEAIADPFQPTAELVELLRVRDAALHATGTRNRRSLRLEVGFPRFAFGDKRLSAS